MARESSAGLGRKEKPPQEIQRHGDDATARARETVEAMRKKGDTDGADVWLRIIVAIGTLGEPSTEARH